MTLTALTSEASVKIKGGNNINSLLSAWDILGAQCTISSLAFSVQSLVFKKFLCQHEIDDLLPGDGRVGLIPVSVLNLSFEPR